MTNDILILAAGLGDVANAGLSDISYSGYDILANKEPNADTIKGLDIFKPIQYILKVVSLFMLLLFGYKIITALTSGKKLQETVRSTSLYLVAAILLWDISIFLNLLGLVTKFAGWIAESVKTLVGGVETVNPKG